MTTLTPDSDLDASLATAEKPVSDGWNLMSLMSLTVGERLINPDDIPWVPYIPGVDVKPLRLNRKTGMWTNLTRVAGGGTVNRHYHGGSVVGYVLEGSWHYIERDWVAKPGMMIWEPPGDVHTLVTGDEGTTTLFFMDGPLFYIDENDKPIAFDDVLTFTKMYHDYCASQGIEPVDLDY